MRADGIRIVDERAFAAAPQAPWLARFAGKLVLDVLPAALASVIGGFLFTQYHLSQPATPRPVAQEGAPASAEMVAMVRDEHALILNYLKAQLAAERSRDRAEDAATARALAEANAAADAKLAQAILASPAATAHGTAPAAKSPARARPAIVAASAPQAPLVIAQAQPANQQGIDGAASDDRLARDPDSLFAKTLDFKDHVVAATRRVVGAIGDIVGSVGEGIGGIVSGGRLFADAS